MNFVEQLFGTAPDGGNGIFEAVLFLIPITVGLALRLIRKKSPLS